MRPSFIGLGEMPMEAISQPIIHAYLSNGYIGEEEMASLSELDGKSGDLRFSSVGAPIGEQLHVSTAVVVLL